MRYPKRLIEVDLPIRRISAHARREKSIRHGHISTLHIWWARRPLAACRAVVCASLWPDPGDELCPARFTAAAKRLMAFWAKKGIGDSSPDSFPRLNKINSTPSVIDDPCELRSTLLDFIADFANWDNSTNERYLAVARTLTVAAHDALEGLNTFGLPERLNVKSLAEAIKDAPRPLLVDPFAGGGSIPLEGLRCGADAFATDLSPVAVLLNKVVLEYVPAHGKRLAKEVERCGRWIGNQAEQELRQFYPANPAQTTPIGYLWARTIRCEGPGCGADVPLLRSLWLAKKANRSVALQLVPSLRSREVGLQIIVKQRGVWVDQDAPDAEVKAPTFEGTVRRGAVTCPCCGYTTRSTRMREQLKARRGGTNDARLVCVVYREPTQTGAQYRLPVGQDLAPPKKADELLRELVASHDEALSPVPDEAYPDESGSGALSASVLYGLGTWGELFPRRAALALVVFSRLVKKVPRHVTDPILAEATTTCLAFCVSKLADYLSSLCIWRTARSCAAHTFGRQALPMAYDYAEMNPFAGSAGDWSEAVRYLGRFIDANTITNLGQGTALLSSATSHPLPDDSAHLVCTDPPYYDAIAYGDLSDFFYVWLRRILFQVHPSLFSEALSDKEMEIVQLSKRFSGPYAHKTQAFFELMMTKALTESRRIASPSGIGVVVFAHKSTSGWEAMLRALIDAGWVVTGSWPIDTERGGRLNANEAASLASSVHIVCRPREDEDGSVTENVGDWRDVLVELPNRIGQWLPRLASEGIVGADAVFACLGPALEIFSRYSSVEKASGEKVELREYLEHVWAEVARQALNMIFEGADASGFEEDARLTAIWLWTLRSGPVDDDGADSDTSGVRNEDDEESTGTRSSKTQRLPGYVLEYDAARKIAQGLGCHLEKLGHLVEVKGDKATLLSASCRAAHLFGSDDVAVTSRSRKRKAGNEQLDLFRQLGMSSDYELEQQQAEFGRPPAGKTVLDQLHQSMLLFSSGRGNALARFLVEDGVGTNAQFWKLAQAFSALYPGNAEEKRWVDGVLARKKSLGL